MRYWMYNRTSRRRVRTSNHRRSRSGGPRPVWGHARLTSHGGRACLVPAHAGTGVPGYVLVVRHWVHWGVPGQGTPGPGYTSASHTCTCPRPRFHLGLGHVIDMTSSRYTPRLGHIYYYLLVIWEPGLGGRASGLIYNMTRPRQSRGRGHIRSDQGQGTAEAEVISDNDRGQGTAEAEVMSNLASASGQSASASWPRPHGLTAILS